MTRSNITFGASDPFGFPTLYVMKGYAACADALLLLQESGMYFQVVGNSSCHGCGQEFPFLIHRGMRYTGLDDIKYCIAQMQEGRSAA